MMAEAKTARIKNRPLSPHLQIYKPLLTMMMSIVHRITGGALFFGMLLLVWWLIAAAAGPNAYATVQWFMETLLGRLHVNQAVPILVDSFPDRSFRGVVKHINDVGEYSPRNLQTADERADQVFATRVELQEGFTELRAGMAAFIKVPK
jgi:hypothetical protein